MRESAEIRDVVGTATRPWTILNIVVSLRFFRRCSRVRHCSFFIITDTLLCCMWSPNTNLAALRFTLSTLSISFRKWGPTLHCCTPRLTSQLRNMRSPTSFTNPSHYRLSLGLTPANYYLDHFFSAISVFVFLLFIRAYFQYLVSCVRFSWLPATFRV